MPEHGRHSAPQEFDQARPGAERQKGRPSREKRGGAKIQPLYCARIALESL